LIIKIFTSLTRHINAPVLNQNVYLNLSKSKELKCIPHYRDFIATFQYSLFLSFFVCVSTDTSERSGKGWPHAVPGDMIWAGTKWILELIKAVCGLQKVNQIYSAICTSTVLLLVCEYGSVNTKPRLIQSSA